MREFLNTPSEQDRLHRSMRSELSFREQQISAMEDARRVLSNLLGYPHFTLREREDVRNALGKCENALRGIPDNE